MRNERLHFLDWLRVFAFLLLIVFHVGLMYTTWDYVFKSPRLLPALEWVLIVFYPWRILLLFFISGVACRFLLERLGAAAFNKDRLLRILPVLLFGTLVINATQNYFEVVSQGVFRGGLLEFWLDYYLVADTSLGKIFPTWDHLWFLAYLLVYACAISLLYVSARRPLEKLNVSVGAVRVYVCLPLLWLAISNVLVSEYQPPTFDFVNDWGVHLRSAGVFVIGFLCAWNRNFWEWTRRHRGGLGITSLSLLSAMVLLRIGDEILFSVELERIIAAVLSGVYAWFTILLIVGYAAQYMNRASPVLSYLTSSILPIYVLHQPIMIAVGFVLFSSQWPLAVEMVFILLATAVLPLLIYELLIRRLKILGFLFGLKSPVKI